MNKISPRDVYELVQNNKGEIMIIIYAKEQAPQKPTFTLNNLSGILKINRTKEDSLIIAGLDIDAIHKIDMIKQLYVCEIKYKESADEESEIVRAYIASRKKESATTSKTNPKQETVSEKAQNARAKALKKTNK